jgi:quercetin dioxygenase-like cupin family protein
MLTALGLVLAVGTVPPQGSSQADDPLTTDPGKYSLVLENERVRVLRYHDRPGEKTSMHRHPDLVLHALAPFKRRLTLAGGKTWEREFKAGEVFWVPAQGHVGENIGDTDTNVIIVELKEPHPAGRRRATHRR